MSELVNVSIGELWDKYTILLIKNEKITSEEKLILINKELELLCNNMKKYNFETNKLFVDLKDVNTKLWDIEDNLRIKESSNTFNAEFIQLARSVYFTNDIRADIKRQINKTFNSNLYEVKDYVKYN
tara:strand:- start:501 stop:881 length:381 start_codon:yes stop_codon:yes gene_type:complete